MSITNFVLTGGPCAGKTTALSYLYEKLSNMGYKIFITPEIATMMIMSGFDPTKSSKSEILEFEKQIIKNQIQYEKSIMKLAKMQTNHGAKVVILHDRGTMDVSAYLEDYEMEAILSNLSLSVTALRDKHYDAVIHMITAADGARDFYTLENNKARFESPEQAIAACKRTMEAWTGHPHLRVIDNSTGFEEKIKRVLREICAVLGEPVPIEIERKFLVSSFDLPFDVVHQTINIEQTYLIRGDNSEERVRKRGQNGSYCYYQTIKTPTSDPMVRQEKEWPIKPLEYLAAIDSRADGTKEVIKKDRTCFLQNNIYYELDVFKNPEGLVLLEVELTDKNKDIEIPSFIKIMKEVTGDPSYSNYRLASV